MENKSILLIGIWAVTLVIEIMLFLFDNVFAATNNGLVFFMIALISSSLIYLLGPRVITESELVTTLQNMGDQLGLLSQEITQIRKALEE
ncbi:MAG: hypothetical protein ACXADC_16060 [Candidatus Thorarchaeota archaeon]|jgi:hypothetical protein